MNESQVHELLLQALETERGGMEVYEAALRCVRNEELRQEWEGYRAETEHHLTLVAGLIETFGIEPEQETPGRAVVRHIGASLVKAMEMALADGPPEAAQLVAAECVALAETKDQLNWELLGELAPKLKGGKASALKAAHDEVGPQEIEHLYHTKGWGRELWIESLGLPAVLPPPEEVRDVKTAIGAERARQAREAIA